MSRLSTECCSYIDRCGNDVNYCPMELDDNLPERRDDPLSLLLRQDLDPLSIDELEERISSLKGEIARCEAKKDAASSHRIAADDLFKK